MKKNILFSLLLSLFFSYKAVAVLTGTYIVPGPGYGSLRAIVDSLNRTGTSGTGPAVVINLTRNEALGPYILGSDTLNKSTIPIIINGGGFTITAHAGTGSTDGIFIVQGRDNVTLDNFKFYESKDNTTATTRMEWGVAGLKYTADDGLVNFNVQNCEIILNNGNTTPASGVSPAGASGIFIGNCTPSSTKALSAPSVIEGTHEGIFLFKNSINNVNNGIYCASSLSNVVSTFSDKNVTVQSNIIENFTHNGVYAVHFTNTQVQSNTISNLGSGGVAPTGNQITGVFHDGDKNTPANNSWTCTGNDIKLTIDGSSGFFAFGVYSCLYGTGSTDVSNNTIELHCNGTANGLEGIRSENNLGTQLIKGNTIHDFSTKVTTNQNILGIRNGQPASPYGYPGNSTISNNVVKRFTAATTANVFGIVDQSSTITGPLMDNNLVDSITITANSVIFRGITIGQGVATANTATITNNTVSNIVAKGTSTPGMGIRTAASNLVSAVVNGNKVKNITFGTGNFAAAEIAYGVIATLDKDTFDNISGEGTIYGIQAGYFNNIAVTTLVFTNNVISNLQTSAAAGSAQGISIAPGISYLTNAATITGNKISGIHATGKGDTAVAIAVLSGTATYNISNNIISNIEAAANTGIFSSSFGMRVLSTGLNNIQYNTVNLIVDKAIPTSGFGASGLLYNPSGTNKIQNNILRVNMTAGSDNNVSAIRSTGGLASAAPSTSGFTAGSNIYYTPPGPNNYLYVDGTTNSSLVNGYHQSGLTENATKNIVNDTFFNSDCNKSSYHNFMQAASGSREKKTYSENNLSGTAGEYAPSGLSYAEGAALDVPEVSTDFKSNPRPAFLSDIGALEFNGTTRPLMDIVITSSTGFDTACTFNLPRLTASVPSFFNRVSYQWYRDTTKLTGVTTTSMTVTAVSGKYIVKVYDSATGCEYPSAAYTMTIVPPPPAIITYYDSLVFCETSAIVIQGNKGPKYTYRWMRNGIFLAGETDDHLVVDKSGDYSLEVNTPLGCATTSTSIRVKVYPLPTPTVFYAGTDILQTERYYLYQWYRNNVKIGGSDAMGQRFYVREDGAYTVEVTDSNGCTAKSDIYLFSLGVNEDRVSGIKVYPNPAREVLHIEGAEGVGAELTDLSGRLVAEGKGNGVLSIGHLAEGMYLLNLHDREGKLIRVQKINKVK